MRVLHVLANRGFFGVSAMIRNYNDVINHEKIIFDAFICSETDPNILDENIIKHQGIVHVAPKMAIRNFKKIKAEFRRVLLEYKYDIVHIHQLNTNFLFLKIANECGAKKIIMHAHSIKFSLGRLKSIRNYFLSKIGKKYITHYAACTKLSAIKLYGKKICNEKEQFIVENVVDTDKFILNQEKRDLFRKQYNLDGKIVLGTVGRLSKEKNIPFLIDVFKEFLIINPNSMLVLIGDGPLRAKIEKQIGKYSLKDKVLLLGRCDNVHELINMLDCFVLPSKFEGYPIALVEAQANGLSCIVSSTISKEVDKGLCEFISLKATKKEWANKLAAKADGNSEARTKSQNGRSAFELGNILTEWYIN